VSYRDAASSSLGGYSKVRSRARTSRPLIAATPERSRARGALARRDPARLNLVGRWLAKVRASHGEEQQDLASRRPPRRRQLLPPRPSQPCGAGSVRAEADRCSPSRASRRHQHDPPAYIGPGPGSCSVVAPKLRRKRANARPPGLTLSCSVQPHSFHVTAGVLSALAHPHSVQSGPGYAVARVSPALKLVAGGGCCRCARRHRCTCQRTPRRPACSQTTARSCPTSRCRRSCRRRSRGPAPPSAGRSRPPGRFARAPTPGRRTD
jgi:hypothetical protein